MNDADAKPEWNAQHLLSPRAAVTAREAQLEDLESAATGLLVLDRDWRILWANRSLAHLAAMPPELWHGARLWGVFPRLRGNREARVLRSTMADGRHRTFRLEYRDEHAGGVFDVRVTCASDDTLLLEVHDVSALLDAPDQWSADADAELLRALARAFSEAASANTMLRSVADIALQCTGSQGVLVTAFEGDETRTLYTRGLPVVSRASRAMLPDSGGRNSRYTDRSAPYDSDAAHGDALVLTVPLVVYGKTAGAIQTCRTADSRSYTADSERRLRLLADHVGAPLWRARLLEEAEAASRAKTSFLATVSHELRTPLTALAGYGELLADGILGEMNPAQGDAVERMRFVTGQLTAIIDEILEYSDLEAGNQTVHLDPVGACSLARQVAAVAGPLAHRKRVSFALDVPDQEVQFVSDGQKVRQILTNLTENAVKFTERGGVTLRVRRDEDRVNFIVEDSGIGISADDQPRLFQPFTQLSTGLTRRYGGAGLGLYISNRLAVLLGGGIAVRSREGAGSAFELSLPAAPNAN